MNILSAVKQLLVDGGVSYEVKLNSLADSPVNQIMIRDTGEVEPDANDTTQMGASPTEERTFQVFVRGSSYSGVVTECTLIRQALHGQIGATKSGFYFLNILTISGFQPITNEIGNYEFSGNFKTKVRAA